MPKSDYNLDELIQNASFRAWTEGRADLGEKRLWDNWVEASAENRRLAREAQQSITGFTLRLRPAPDTPQAWNEIDRQLDLRVPLPSAERPGLASRRGVYVAAASVLIVLAAALTYLLSHQGVEYHRERVTTGYGERKKIILSDGSAIVLNAHSSLSYTPGQTMKEGVNIGLKGEAYFTVAKRQRPDDAPFTVNTSDGRVSVLGTRFVVSTRERQTQVVLERGKVAINQRSQSLTGSAAETVLEPNEMARFSRFSDKVRISSVNPDVYTSWSTNTLVFDHTPVSEIKKRLAHTFGLHVMVRSPELNGRVVSGAIENAGVPVITSALSKALGVPFTISKDTVYIGEKE